MGIYIFGLFVECWLFAIGLPFFHNNQTQLSKVYSKLSHIPKNSGHLMSNFDWKSEPVKLYFIIASNGAEPIMTVRYYYIGATCHDIWLTPALITKVPEVEGKKNEICTNHITLINPKLQNFTFTFGFGFGFAVYVCVWIQIVPQWKQHLTRTLID